MCLYVRVGVQLKTAGVQSVYACMCGWGGVGGVYLPNTPLPPPVCRLLAEHDELKRQAARAGVVAVGASAGGGGFSKKDE